MTGSSLPPEGARARQAYLLLRDRIERGAWADGDALPGEPRLAESLGVSRVTLRRALDALASAGLVERRRGAPTRIRRAAGDGPAMRVDLANLWAHLAGMGARSRARLLAFSYAPAPPGVADALGVAPGARLQRSVRVRHVEDAPFSHLTTHVPEPVAARISEADMATTPLYLLLERAGVRLARARQSVSATLADAEVAEALDLAVGAPLIALTRVTFDAEGQGVEHLSALYRPDRYRFDMELARVGEGEARRWAPDSLNGDAR